MPKIIINDQSIKNRLKTYDEKPALAILEYLWNGFDAGANNIWIKYSFKQKMGEMACGYPDLEIIDDGEGWDIKNAKATNLFLVSSKIANHNKSLPQGKDGVGRFTFYAFAQKAVWHTVYGGKKFKLSLESGKLDEYTLEEDKPEIDIKNGTRVTFDVISSKITEPFLQNELIETIKLEFCWFLMLYPNKKIFLNEKQIDISNLVAKKNETGVFIDKTDFDLTLVQWKEKPTRESSKYYFTDKDGKERFAKTTGLNYQSDDFFHSVYIRSDFFKEIESENGLIEDEKGSLSLLPVSKEDKKNKATYNKLLGEIKKKLEVMRKPFLKKLSQRKIDEWKENKVLPDVRDLGLNQRDYEKIVKEVNTAIPQLLKNCGEDQRKIILRLIPALISSDDKEALIKILDQVYKLSPEDKKTLSELLEKTTLSNIIRTIKEIDDRLSTLLSLETILLDRDFIKYTREVDHLQKVLDENFWIFGEDYRLFASAEGSIRKTLIDFKNNILRKEDEEIKTKSRKELDLFMAKTEETSRKVSCVVVEIKRPSVTLGKKQYDQIYEYMETILSEPSCCGSKMEWRFYLIGNDYDSYIEKQIDNSKGWGEQDEGLAFVIENKKAKLYIKKWSDIINVEQKSRYNFLKSKLDLRKQTIEGASPSAIVSELSSKKIKA